MELEEAIKKLKTLNQEKYEQDTILSLYSNFIDEDEENQPYILTPFERDAIEVVLNHLTKQEKMIDLMSKHIRADDIDEDICQYEGICNEYECEECIKQYYEKKAEED